MSHFGVKNVGEGTTPSSISVTTTSTEILAANPNRKWACLSNIGNQDVYLAMDQTAIASAGFVLRAGENYVAEAPNLTLGAINGITSMAFSTVTFQEAE